MRICHLTSVHPSSDTRVFHRMCCSLANLGHQITLVVAGESPRTVQGVKIASVPRSGTRWGRVTFTAFRVVLRGLKERADVYHLHDPELLPWALLLVMRGYRVIYDAHEDYAEDLLKRPYLPATLRRPVARMVEILERALVLRMSGIVGATDFIATKLSRYGRPTVAVRNYSRTDELHAERGVRPGRQVVYVGNIMESRGILQIIEACAIADADLVLAGTFETPELRGKAIATSGWRRVIELGHVSRGDLPGKLAGCSVGLLIFHPDQNWLVSQPLKLFEYMSAGLPVIASDFPLWKRLVEENGCGVCVDPLDVQAIASAISRILSDVDLASEMGRRGRNLIRSKYNWEGELQTLVRFYEKIATSRG